MHLIDSLFSKATTLLTLVPCKDNFASLSTYFTTQKYQQKPLTNVRLNDSTKKFQELIFRTTPFQSILYENYFVIFSSLASPLIVS